LHLRHSTLPLIIIVVMLSVAACGSSDKSAASATALPTSAASATETIGSGSSPSATNAPASGPSATTAPESSPSTTPSGTDIPADVLAVVQVLKTAATSGEILDHAQLTPTECREVVPPITAFPKCAQGTQSGTLIPQFRMAMCESVAADDVAPNLDAWAAVPRTLYAVTRDSPGGDNLFNWIPVGDYGIIFTDQDGSGMLFTVANGQIVGASAACGQPPSYLMDKLPHTAVLLGPLPAN